MSNERKVLAYKLKEYRKEHRLNQFEFAEDCGISRETLSLIERQAANVTIDTAQLLASRIGVTVSDLLNSSATTYFILPGKVEIEGVKYETYGIGVLKNGIMIDCVHDISADFNKVKSLVNLCNENGLSPLHLHDAAEDALLD